jgi:hypothetical protein
MLSGPARQRVWLIVAQLLSHAQHSARGLIAPSLFDFLIEPTLGVIIGAGRRSKVEIARIAFATEPCFEIRKAVVVRPVRRLEFRCLTPYIGECPDHGFSFGFLHRGRPNSMSRLV